MDSNNRNRRIAVGAAFVAALIGVAPAARADTDLNPFEDLFGDSGFNSWTPAADASLPATLAASMDQTVDNFLTSTTAIDNPGIYSPFTELALFLELSGLDPSAFSGVDPLGFPIPNDAIGDFAVGLDYTVFASGLAPAVDPSLDVLVLDLLLLLGVGVPSI
jgi:hypothetical protein